MANGENFKASMIGVTGFGTAIVFDFGFTDDSGGSTHIDTNLAAGDFQTLVQATMVAVLRIEYSVVKYRFACVHGAHIGEVGHVVVSPPVQGTQNIASPLPTEMCISLKRDTGFSSRHDRGRIFLSPLDSNYQDGTNPDKVNPDSLLQAARDLLKANLTTSAVVLKPVILAADGSFDGHKVIHTDIGNVFVHHRSRRWRSGI